MTRRRLDVELVRRGLARSRAQATEMIAAQLVQVNGLVSTKVHRQVAPADSVRVIDAPNAQASGVGQDMPRNSTWGSRWASRGAHKLLGALDATGVDPADRVCLDAGASTGGFTHVLLDGGARRVHAVDVGYGQLVWALRSEPRVVVHDRCNVRHLTSSDLGEAEPITLVVADLSFISLQLVMGALADLAAPGADFLLMVKPQFEVGRNAVPKTGVVTDPLQRQAAVVGVADAAEALDLSVAAVAPSPLPGPKGNREFFLWLREISAAGTSIDCRQVTGIWADPTKPPSAVRAADDATRSTSESDKTTRGEGTIDDIK